MAVDFRRNAEGTAGMSMRQLDDANSKLIIIASPDFQGDSQSVCTAIKLAIDVIQSGGKPTPLNLSEIANYNFNDNVLRLKATAKPDSQISTRDLITIRFPEGQTFTDEQAVMLMDCLRDQSPRNKPTPVTPKGNRPA